MQLFQNPMIPNRNQTGSLAKTAVLGIGTALLVFGLTACQATSNLFGKVDDGSLQYKDAKRLEPLKLPAEQETAPFIPLYPTPRVGVNTLKLENEAGKRYELPPPYHQISVE